MKIISDVIALSALLAATFAFAADDYFYNGTARGDDSITLAALLDSTTGAGKWANNGNTVAADAIREGVPSATDNLFFCGGVINTESREEAYAANYYCVGRGWGQYTTNNITGGTLNIASGFLIGWWSDGHGVVNMTDGEVNADYYLIADSGRDAEFNQSGGTVRTTASYMGIGNGAAGAW